MKKETLLAISSSMHAHHTGAVNVPPHRASTILFPTMNALHTAEGKDIPDVTYGRYGTPSSASLEDLLAKLEGSDHAIVTSSGLAAIVNTLTAFLGSGDHMLMTDSVYGPARRFCDGELKRLGVETEYYDPLIGADIAKLIKPNTRLVYVESPGSLSFEVQDVPAISKAAHAKGVLVVSDSTWGTPIYFRPFDLGIDVSIHSVTKYLSGHSDLVMGMIACKNEHYKKLVTTYRNMGACPSADNCYLAQRGMRTLNVRLKQQYENAMVIAKWLKTRPEVEEVLYPALPGAPGHDIWKRDFSGAASLFAIALKPVSKDAVAAMVDPLELFGIGYSWGGYESLIMPFDLSKHRTARPWPYKGPGIRIHIGLENTDDIIADLEKGFGRLRGKL